MADCQEGFALGLLVGFAGALAGLVTYYALGRPLLDRREPPRPPDPSKRSAVMAHRNPTYSLDQPGD
jgi:hypothetical protein